MTHFRNLHLLSIALLLSAGLTVRLARGDVPLRLPDGDAAFFSTLDLDRPDLAQLKEAVARQDWSAARHAWASHLQQRTTPTWIWSRQDRAAIEQVFSDNYGGLKKFVPEADRVLARQFDILGVKKTLTHDPQWDQGKQEWTHVLSRFGYLFTLGQAYWATKDAKYADDFVYLIEHWIAENPAPEEVAKSWSATGTRWRTLETGIRAYTLFDDIEIFMDAPQFDADAKTLLSRSLLEHARRLYAHETAFHQGNWQVCECAGLACIGIMLPEFKEAEQWRTRGLDYLAQHMQKDVYPDGAHWELTPGYHEWVTSEFLLISRLCQLNHIQTPPGLLSRHEKMYEFLMHLAKPDRVTFAVGDDGSGTNIEPDMATGALLYGRKDMRWLGPQKVPESLVWIFGPQVVQRYAALPAEPPDPSSYLMPDAHFAVMRTGWSPEDKCLLFNCAPWGGGHDHRDRLEVCLYAGRNLLIDPGQISYDQKLSRTYFRTAQAHNTMTIDDQDPPPIGAMMQAWKSTAAADFASASLDYNNLHQQRIVLFVRPDYWIIVDRVSATHASAATQPSTTTQHLLQRRFHFSPGEAHAEAGAAYSMIPGSPEVGVIDATNTPAAITSGWIASGTATADAGAVALFENHDSLPAVHCTVLIPLKSPEERPSVEQLGGEQLAGATMENVQLRISFPDGRRDDFVIGNGERVSPLSLDNDHANAWAIGDRSDSKGKQLIVVGP